MGIPVCLACKERAAICRGCCIRCHGRHRKAVQRGQTTWAALEIAGLSAPAQRPGATWMQGFATKDHRHQAP
jgi:hypothetical protein